MEQERNAKVSLGFLYAPVTTLGYGKRVGIWVAGCNKNCANCMTPDLRKFDYNYNQNEVISYVGKKLSSGLDGITISGGEPFEQPKFLLALIKEANKYTDDILVYTGYTYEELVAKDNEDVNSALKYIGILVDGEYVDSLNDGLALRGSSNQRTIFLKENLKNKYENVLKDKRKTQMVTVCDQIFFIGIK